MEDKLPKKVKEYVRQKDLIRKGDRILAAVSGGADSVCLLYVLQELQQTLEFELRVVHVHHGIRENAEKDLLFVENLCSKMRLPCTVYREHVPEALKDSGMSLEEMARKIRYEDFRKALKEWKDEEGVQEASGEAADRSRKDGEELLPVYRIATAHHLTDQAETVLFRLFRGTGITGLGGIRPLSGDVIRPLLETERQEIETYLRERKIPYRTDESNSDVTYSRNRIRHNLLPEAEKVCEGAIRHVGAAAEILQETEQYLESLGQKALAACRIKAGDVPEEGQDPASLVLERELFQREDPFLQKQMLLQMLRHLPSGGRDITAEHLSKMLELTAGAQGGELHLPMDVTFLCRQGRIWLSIPGTGQDHLQRFCRERGLPAGLFGKTPDVYGTEILSGPVKEYDLYRVEERGRSLGDLAELFDDRDGALLKNLTIRHRERGDHMVTDREGHRKPLKEILIEEKIPREYRDLMWLPAVGSEILWIPGIRRSRSAYIKADTGQILRLYIREL